MGAGVILGDWTHRRGDPGGSRAVGAELRGSKPRVAWTWTPRHGGRVEQVRTLGDHVFVATLGPRDADAPGWEHAVVYALDAARGKVVGERVLADPSPVAAMVVEGPLLHLIATRWGEPVLWYTLRGPELAPVRRQVIAVEGDPRFMDVLDAWASPDGGLWLEVEDTRLVRRAFAFVAVDTEAPVSPIVVDGEEGAAEAESRIEPRDACAAGGVLLVPASVDQAAALFKLEAQAVAKSLWVADDAGAGVARAHGIVADGGVSVVTLRTVAGRASLGAVLLDRSTGVVRSTTAAEEVPQPIVSASARIVRRPGGEVVVQGFSSDGTPSADVVGVSAEGPLVTFKLGARPYVLDLALGEALLVHRDSRPGRVLLAPLGMGKDERWLGRHASIAWSLEVPAHGGSCAVYAGAGHIFVRGRRGLAAVSL
jgi:hypothetical protein